MRKPSALGQVGSGAGSGPGRTSGEEDAKFGVKEGLDDLRM